MEKQSDVIGSARIGRTGTKLHPAKIITYDGMKILFITCGCAGTKNGAATNKARFFEGVQSNCKN